MVSHAVTVGVLVGDRQRIFHHHVEVGYTSSEGRHCAMRGNNLFSYVTIASPTPRSKVVIDSRPLLPITFTLSRTRVTKSAACSSEMLSDGECALAL